MALPPFFWDLSRASAADNDTFVNIIGVVVDLMPTTTTRTAEQTLMFRLMDRSLTYSHGGYAGLKVRFFSRNDDIHLPNIRAIGDFVLLRSVKMSTWCGERVALSNYHTGFLVFPSSAIPTLEYKVAYQGKNKLQCRGVPMQVNMLSQPEQDYIMDLKPDMQPALKQLEDRNQNIAEQQAMKRLNAPEQPREKRHKPNTMSNCGLKFRLVKELVAPNFYADVCGFVVKSIPTQYGSDLYLTDYTPNEQMRRYPPPEEEDFDEGRDGDDFQYTGPKKKAWPGPYEFLILKVNVKPPHATFVNHEVREGDLVRLFNMKCRISPDAKLEGDLWPDHLNPERVRVLKVSNRTIPEVVALLRRKDQYWASREQKLAAKQVENKETLSRKQKKKLKKLEKAQGKEQQTVVWPADKDHCQQEDDAEDTFPVKGLNPHIRCSAGDTPISKLRDIVDAENRRHTATLPDGRTWVVPFINANYRSRVRVVDYHPKPLTKFTFQPEEQFSSTNDSMAWQYDAPRFEWNFSLLLEDATKSSSKKSATPDDRLWVHLHNNEAQFLLGNRVGDPEDLEEHHVLLRRLREKLFVLWGNLQEKKPWEDLSNVPFECCIQEYGIEEELDDRKKDPATLGWRRMYGMFGTTIL